MGKMPLLSKGKSSPYLIAERRVSEMIPVLGSQPAGEASHKPSIRLPLLSSRPAVTLTTLKRAATNFAAWWTEAWLVCWLQSEPRPYCTWVQHPNHSATKPHCCLLANNVEALKEKSSDPNQWRPYCSSSTTELTTKQYRQMSQLYCLLKKLRVHHRKINQQLPFWVTGISRPLRPKISFG